MKSLNGAAVVAAWSALAGGGLAVAQDADCNVNGIPDATEIAQGLADDCNGNGIPDVCEYAGVTLEADQSGFGNGNPLVATFTDVESSISDVRLAIEVRADLDSVGEFVQVKLGGSVVTTLWVTGGQACPSEPQSQTVTVTADAFNAALTKGTIVISLEPSGIVSVKECPTSSASVITEYISDLGPADCLGTGVWDGCDIAADPSLDCDGNGLVDTCEIDGDSGLDCDGNGLLDVCDLETDPSLDCDGNGAHDACDIAADALADCDGNGLLDACEIASGNAEDCDGNGILDSCDLDCDLDGIPDACAIASGSVADCNGNGRPDSCEVTPGQYFDVDCDLDGIPDDCQIAANPSLDENGDRVLDACQYARGDFNLDLEVGPADLALLIGFWGTPDPPVGDLNDDGTIDGQDLGILLIYWGAYSAPWGVVLEFSPDPQIITDPEWRSRISATGLPWRVRDNASQIEMLLVPPGTFMMGCSPSLNYGCNPDETPVHEVTLTQPYYLGRYEVTQAQWTAVMGSNPSHFQSPSSQVPADQVPNRPVERVSWYAIQSFGAATGLRLPTEAEWEYACRAGTTAAFNLPPDGTNDDGLLGQVAWSGQSGGNSVTQTRPVGQKLANNLGLHDMHGNVWEWVEDRYGIDYYAQSPAIDPPGPTSGGDGVLRGGSWSFDSFYCRASDRLKNGLDNDNIGVSVFGFRAAKTP